MVTALPQTGQRFGWPSGVLDEIMSACGDGNASLSFERAKHPFCNPQLLMNRNESFHHLIHLLPMALAFKALLAKSGQQIVIHWREVALRPRANTQARLNHRTMQYDP